MQFRTQRAMVVTGAAGTLMFLVALAVYGGNGAGAQSSFPAVYSNSPVVGQYSYVTDSGTTLVNGYAYSYVTLDLTKLTPGSQFTFLPSVNIDIGGGTTPPQIVVTSTAQNVSPSGLSLSWKVFVPDFGNTIDMTSTVGGQMTSTGVASLGSNGAHIFIQPEQLDAQTVKVYFYLGGIGMPLAP